MREKKEEWELELSSMNWKSERRKERKKERIGRRERKRVREKRRRTGI
jgi:hypothetical protein